jgi:hypothetical protein
VTGHVVASNYDALVVLLDRARKIFLARSAGTIGTVPLDARLGDEAQRLRKQAQGTPPGIEHERLIRRARQAETASQMNEWLTSRGLQPPAVLRD